MTQINFKTIVFPKPDDLRVNVSLRHNIFRSKREQAYSAWRFQCSGFIPREIWDELRKKHFCRKLRTKMNVEVGWYYTLDALYFLLSKGFVLCVDGVMCRYSSKLEDRILSLAWPKHHMALKSFCDWSEAFIHLVDELRQALGEREAFKIDEETGKRLDGKVTPAHKWGPCEICMFNEEYIFDYSYFEPRYEFIYAVAIAQFKRTPGVNVIFEKIQALEAIKKDLPDLESLELPPIWKREYI